MNKISNIDSKERFSNVVEDYVKFRPTYPSEALDCIIENTGISIKSVIADLGSGTGIFTKLLLQRNFQVFAVEPNSKMREVAENQLLEFKNFSSIASSAEKTTLQDNSMDLITVAQAFHWFDGAACQREFRRILKPSGHVSLIWNRHEAITEFMKNYQKIIKQYHGEYPNLQRDKINKTLFDMFFCGNYMIYNFFWNQSLTFTELWGRAQSSSYAPPKEHPNYEPRKAELLNLFNNYSREGFIKFEYMTEVVIGSLCNL